VQYALFDDGIGMTVERGSAASHTVMPVSCPALNSEISNERMKPSSRVSMNAGSGSTSVFLRSLS
jgi:hypothetical protein